MQGDEESSQRLKEALLKNGVRKVGDTLALKVLSRVDLQGQILKIEGFVPLGGHPLAGKVDTL